MLVGARASQQGENMSCAIEIEYMSISIRLLEQYDTTSAVLLQLLRSSRKDTSYA